VGVRPTPRMRVSWEKGRGKKPQDKKKTKKKKGGGFHTLNQRGSIAMSFSGGGGCKKIKRQTRFRERGEKGLRSSCWVTETAKSQEIRSC